MKILFSDNEPVERLFERIKSLDIEMQIACITNIKDPKRTELFNLVLQSEPDHFIREQIALTKVRIDKSCQLMSGFRQSDIDHHHSLFVKDFQGLFHSDNLNEHIEDKIRELKFYCERLRMDLRADNYTFIGEDDDQRKEDKNAIIESERYIIYLENLIVKFSDQKSPSELEHIATQTSPRQNKGGHKTFNVMDVAIACHVLDIPLTEERGRQLVAKYTISKAPEHLYKDRYKITEAYFKVEGNKRIDNRKREAIENAKRLIAKLKNKLAYQTISQYLQRFERDYRNIHN